MSREVFGTNARIRASIGYGARNLYFVLRVSSGGIIGTGGFISNGVHFFHGDVILATNRVRSVLSHRLSDVSSGDIISVVIFNTIDNRRCRGEGAVVRGGLSHFVRKACDSSTLDGLVSTSLVGTRFSRASFSTDLLASLLTSPGRTRLTCRVLGSLGRNGWGRAWGSFLRPVY